MARRGAYRPDDGSDWRGEDCCEKKERHGHGCRGRRGGGGGAPLYGLGVLGAAVYFIQGASGFWAGVLGVIKAFFWPALVLWKVLGLLQL